MCVCMNVCMCVCVYVCVCVGEEGGGEEEGLHMHLQWRCSFSSNSS